MWCENLVNLVRGTSVQHVYSAGTHFYMLYLGGGNRLHWIDVKCQGYVCSTHTAAIMFTPHLKLKMFTQHWNECSVSSSTEFCVQMKVANHPIKAKCLLEVLRCDMISSICWYFLHCNLQIKPYAWIEYQYKFIINKFDGTILLYRTIIIQYCNNSTLLI